MEFTEVICPDCGKVRQVTIYFYKGVIKNNGIFLCRTCSLKRRFPNVEKTIKKEVVPKKLSPKEIEINGCTLIKQKEGRCSKYENCIFFEKCLNQVVELDWNGWKEISD